MQIVATIGRFQLEPPPFYHVVINLNGMISWIEIGSMDIMGVLCIIGLIN